SSVTAGGFETRRSTYPFLIMIPVSPNLVGAIFFVVRLPHSCDRYIGGNTFGKVETVIGRFEGTRAGPFPFMGIAESLAHGPTDERRFAGAHPNDRVDAGDIGK